VPERFTVSWHPPQCSKIPPESANPKPLEIRGVVLASEMIHREIVCVTGESRVLGHK
jgi:hypothetical protein